MIEPTGHGSTLVSLVAATLLVLAACGGGSDGEGATTPGTPAGDGTPAPATEEVTTEAAPDDAQAAVATPSEPVRVTYRMTGDGADDLTELTLSWDSPRYAMLFADGKLVVTEEETLFCDAEGEGCFRMGSDGAGPMAGALGPFFGFTAALQEGERLPDATVTSEAEIAGRTATCATYDAAQYDPTLQGEAEYCFDPDSGVLLRWSATDESGNTQTLEATEIGEPDPSDFEPTGPVQDMPGGGGG